MKTTKDCVYRGRYYYIENIKMIISENEDMCAIDNKPFSYKKECNKNCKHYHSRFKDKEQE